MNNNLQKLQPINSLNPGNLEILSEKIKLQELLPGNCIKAADEHRNYIYVVQGSVEILDNDLIKETIKADSKRSYHPLFRKHSNKEVVAKIRTYSKIISIEKELFKVLKHQEQNSCLEINDIELTDEEGVIFNAIYQDIANNRTELFSLPSRIETIHNTLRDHTAITTQNFAKVLQSDPILCAKMIPLSTEKRGPRTCKNIPYCIQNIGMTEVKDYVIETITQQNFEFKHDIFKERMRKLYKYSIYISLISGVIAKEITNLDADNAMFAGLIHDIGVVPIIIYLDQNDYHTLPSENIDKLLANLRGLIGELILQNWNCPEDILITAEHAKNWARDINQDIDICDTVIAAQVISQYNSCYSYKTPNINQGVSSCLKLDLTEGQEFINIAKQQLKILTQLLS